MSKEEGSARARLDGMGAGKSREIGREHATPDCIVAPDQGAKQADFPKWKRFLREALGKDSGERI